MQLDTACAVQIFIICAVVNYFLARYAFMTVLVGGALGFMRYVAVYCYRYGTHCFGPFKFWYFNYFVYSSNNRIMISSRENVDEVEFHLLIEIL